MMPTLRVGKLWTRLVAILVISAVLTIITLNLTADRSRHILELKSAFQQRHETATLQRVPETTDPRRTDEPTDPPSLNEKPEIQRPNETALKLMLNFQSNETKTPWPKLYSRYHNLLKSSLGDIIEEFQVPDDFIVYENRKRHLKTQCYNLKKTSSLFNATVMALWYFQEADTLYCPVAKVGSTFWRRVWHATMLPDNQLYSPFQFSFGDFNPKTNGVEVDLKNLRPTANLNFLFTRDPYSRIFSAYVDKIVSPNFYLWGVGRELIKRFRANPSKKSLECGHDVTFEEFLKHILTTPSRKLNPHFRPVHMLCDVCNQTYDIIGKMETFKHDSVYLMKRLNILGKKVTFQHSGIEQAVDFVVDLSLRVFEQKVKLQSCMTFHVAMLRMWRHLQISGILSKEKHYPLTPTESETVTIIEVINIILEAYKTSNGAKSNKQEAFLMAYQQIAPSTLDQIRQKFQLDFTLFDYEERPATLFDKTEMTKSEFDYFDVLKE